MKVFPSKVAELISYVEHNDWGPEDIVALNMLKKKGFKAEEAAQLLLVSRRTGRQIENIMFDVLLMRFSQFSKAMRRNA